MVMWLSAYRSTRLFAPLRVMSNGRRFLEHMAESACLLLLIPRGNAMVRPPSGRVATFRWEQRQDFSEESLF